jgi:hypothetical protein
MSLLRLVIKDLGLHLEISQGRLQFHPEAGCKMGCGEGD